MQNFFDTATGKLWAFNDDVKIAGTPGALIFTAPHGATLAAPGHLVPATAAQVPAPPTPLSAAQAQTIQVAGAALASCHETALRCFMAGKPFPAAWQTYHLAARAALDGAGTVAFTAQTPTDPTGV